VGYSSWGLGLFTVARSHSDQFLIRVLCYCQERRGDPHGDQKHDDAFAGHENHLSDFFESPYHILDKKPVFFRNRFPLRLCDLFFVPRGECRC
jgi:hypothetical protein